MKIADNIIHAGFLICIIIIGIAVLTIAGEAFYG
jgi:hypothetical protein